jgi:hypothetical protein
LLAQASEPIYVVGQEPLVPVSATVWYSFTAPFTGSLTVFANSA